MTWINYFRNVNTQRMLLACLLVLPLAGVGCSDSDDKSDPAEAAPEDGDAAAGDDSAEAGNGDESDSEPPPPNRAIGTIVAIGDSITRGSEPGSGSPYPSRVAGILGTKVINRGSPGATSASAPGAAASAMGSSKMPRKRASLCR